MIKDLFTIQKNEKIKKVSSHNNLEIALKSSEMDEDEFENVYIDLVNMKIFALLMCPGTKKEKAGYLFDLVRGGPPKKNDF
jgi:hypothetical protein